MPKFVEFKGAKIPQYEMEVLKEIEENAIYEFQMVEEIDYHTEMGFEVRDNRIFGLGFFNSGLKNVPESIEKLSSLLKLNLNCNLLRNFPNSITKLPSLEILNLSHQHHKMTDLPESIGEFNSLKELYLAENDIRMLPESFGNLKSLKRLSLSRNKLKTLPESIGNLTSLRTLYLDNNQLMTLPESIYNLTSLRALFIDENQLITIPKSLCRLPLLKALFLAKNPITELPSCLFDLDMLEILVIPEDNLTQFPDSINNFKILKEFHEDLKFKLGSMGLWYYFPQDTIIFVKLDDSIQHFHLDLSLGQNYSPTIWGFANPNYQKMLLNPDDIIIKEEKIKIEFTYPLSINSTSKVR